MKIAAISDTHGRGGWAVPPCDVFIHAGDMTGCGTLGETAVFAWVGAVAPELVGLAAHCLDLLPSVLVQRLSMPAKPTAMFRIAC